MASSNTRLSVALSLCISFRFGLRSSRKMFDLCFAFAMTLPSVPEQGRRDD